MIYYFCKQDLIVNGEVWKFIRPRSDLIQSYNNNNKADITIEDYKNWFNSLPQNLVNNFVGGGVNYPGTSIFIHEKLFSILSLQYEIIEI